MLVTFVLASNRPDNLFNFFENLAATTADPSAIEVIVKIDVGDEKSKEVLDQAISKHPYSIKYIYTPRLGGYFDLWKTYNELWELTDEGTYFVWPITDEIRMDTPHWDNKLRNYVGLFDDHVFRLKFSHFKFRNYYRLWECCYAPENFALFSRKWIELVGGFGECHGLDAYHQCVSFYLGKLDRWTSLSRDVPVLDISIGGEEANVGNTEEEMEDKSRNAIRSWFTLVSYESRLNYMKHACIIHAYIDGHRLQLENFTIGFHDKSRRVLLADDRSGRILRTYDVRLARLPVLMENLRYRIESMPGSKTVVAIRFALGKVVGVFTKKRDKSYTAVGEAVQKIKRKLRRVDSTDMQADTTSDHWQTTLTVKGQPVPVVCRHSAPSEAETTDGIESQEKFYPTPKEHFKL